MKTEMPVLSDSWEASSLLNLILSESFALIYSGHWYCKSNLQPCARGKTQGCVASATQQSKGSRAAQKPLLCLRVAHSLVSSNHAFPGRTDFSCVLSEWDQPIHWSQSSFSSTLLVLHSPLHYKFHYLNFIHSIFAFLSKNGLSSYSKINCLFF